MGEGADDAGLMRAVATGDLEAFGRLYDAYGALVYAFCLRLLREREAAEEATQEGFLRVWRAARSFDPARGSLRSWVIAIAHRCCLDRMRQRQRAAPPLDPADLEALPEQGPSPEEAAVRSEQARQVRAALAGLPPEQRRALTLMYYAGYSQSEIASALGLPLGTVKSRTRLGLQALRRGLQERRGGRGDLA